MNDREELERLRQEEQTLEKMRAMVSPALWPRVYAMLQRVRNRIRELETAPGSDHHRAA